MNIYRIIGNESRVPILHDLRKCAGLVSNTVVSFELVSGDTVLVRREQLKDQEDPPAEMPSLRELLESLTPKQQETTRCYLAIYRLGEGP